MSNEKKSERQRIPLLPLRDIIVFPNMVLPLFVGREKSIAALESAMAGSKEIVLSAQTKAKTNDPTPDDIFEVGTVAVIDKLFQVQNGTVKVLVRGKRRVRILEYHDNESYFDVDVEPLEDIADPVVDIDEVMSRVRTTFQARPSRCMAAANSSRSSAMRMARAFAPISSTPCFARTPAS